ncbi:methionyl-tRNA formyltransferase [Suttonella sp. R2A3]|uniref:methionyl-tRNA formyltransferase n=1 Tax=Suttonella sp. R2A3 TaxID=2908648 RepID=UPI001F000037|nr:methionyl-tRNA formyltransferase [Suttonella sp. R2A3]UJF24174.1 methionyl-tRNA formyltransferase [Suttonella sp. R2A3]
MSTALLKVWFAGTPEFAAHSLIALINAANVEVCGVLTQPDRPAGRGRKLQASAVKTVALEHELPLAQPESLRHPQPLFEQSPDVIIVAAYGLLLPRWFLALPRLGCINIHASLLPRWRGAAPIQRAIEAGDEQTGIAIMQMDEGLDTGAVWLNKALTILKTDSASSLHDKLMTLGADALLEALPIIAEQTQQPTPQDNTLATYAHKLSKAEALIDWSDDAQTIARRVRAFSPFPVAHTTLEDKTLRIHDAQVSNASSEATPGTIIAHDEAGVSIACGAGVLCVTRLQFAGKPISDAASLRHGNNLTGKQCV